MKILITTELYAPVINGVVTSVLTLQDELRKRGHDVRILTLSDTGHSYREGNVTYISSMGAGAIYPDARVALRIRNKYVDELIYWCPDLVHSQSEFSTFIIAFKISKELGIPIVHTYHTIYEDYTHYFSPSKKLGKAAVALFTKQVLDNTRFIIAPTNKVKNMLMAYGVNKSIVVVPTGIDLYKFETPADALKLEGLRKSIGIPRGNKAVITVGRLAKEKNLEEIIEFISRINNPEITLIIIGDGPNRENLECYAKELNLSGRVIFTGMIEPYEIVNYYKLGDVFVSASNSEAQGLTYIEALASGVPVLCRKDPCLENVIMDGVNGWQYTSYEHFEDRLNALLYQDILHEKISRNARTGVITEFSSSAFGNKILQIYEASLTNGCGNFKRSSIGS